MSLVKVNRNTINDLQNISSGLADFFDKHQKSNFKFSQDDKNKIKNLNAEGIVTDEGLKEYIKLMNSHNDSNICYYELNENNKTIKLLNFKYSENNEVFQLNDNEFEVLWKKSDSIREWDDIFLKHNQIDSLINDNHDEVRVLIKDKENALKKLVTTIEGLYKNEIAIIKSIKDKEDLDFKSIVDFCLNVENKSQDEIKNIKDTISFFSLKGWSNGTIRAIKRDRKYQLETCIQNINNMYEDIKLLGRNLYGDAYYGNHIIKHLIADNLKIDIKKINEYQYKLQNKLQNKLPKAISSQSSIFDCCFAKRVRENELIYEVNLSRNIKEDKEKISRSSSMRSNGMKMDKSMRSRFSKSSSNKKNNINKLFYVVFL